MVGGVAAGVDFAEVLDAHFGVDGGGFEFFVAEELLDDADVRLAFERVGGAGDGSRRGSRCGLV